MKKKIYLLIAAVALSMFTACGADREHGKSAEQAGNGVSEAETGIDAMASGANEGGENAAPPDMEYEKITFTYSEPMEGFAFRKDLEKTQTDYAAYYFDASISEQDRNGCIAATDRMLSCIDEPPEIEVVVLEQEFYDGVSFSDHRLYLSPQLWDSADYLAKALLAGYGGWGNYGLAYGYADHLCRKAESDEGEGNSEGQARNGLLPMSAPEMYDLNLLCFDDRFVSPGDVEAAKNNACMFVSEYLSSHSEEDLLELLSASGTVEGAARAKEELEAFYAENGVECSVTEIRYQYGGVAMDYLAACRYARFYIQKDWQDEYWEINPLVSENFLHEDYEEVREFFECNERQMGQFQELFGFDSYNNDLPIVFDDGWGAKSAYFGDFHTIHLISIVSLMHEYVHSLMFGHFDDWESLWKREGAARYFSHIYDRYQRGASNDGWNSSPIIWVQEYIDTIGRPIDEQTDFLKLEDLTVHAAGRIDPNFSYESGSSFIGYLVERYGEQAVIAYICSDNDYNAEWGKSYDELAQEWKQYIEENYSQYSTNAMQ